MWRVIVRVEMGGGWYWLYEYRRRASLGMPSKRGVWPRRFRGAAHHGTARKTPQDQLNTPVHWARWTVRQQLTLRRHQARPKPRLGSLCIVSERGHAKGTRSQCPWYWIRSTPTSKSQEFGGLQPRDERSRHPSLGLPRVSAESDTGRPIFSGPANWWRIGGANVWHILLDPSWLHEQAAVGLRCRRLLELLKPSDPVGHLLRPRDVLPIARA